MSRLAPLDKALVLILVPLWIVCFGLSIRTLIAGHGPVLVALSVEGDDHYPVLTGRFSRVIHSSDPLLDSGLQAGDRLIRIGEADLRGVGTAGFTARTMDQEATGLRVPLVFERGGERRETSLVLAPVSIFAPGIAGSGVLGALAILPLAYRAAAPPPRSPSLRAWYWLLGAVVGTAALGNFTEWMGIAEIVQLSTAAIGMGGLLLVSTRRYHFSRFPSLATSNPLAG